MKKRFAFGMLASSLVYSAIGFVLSLAVLINLFEALPGDFSDTALGRILICGLCLACTLFFGYMGIRVALWLKRTKYREAPVKRNVAFVLLLTFVIGCVGQLLYSLEFKTFTRVVEGEMDSKGAHVVLLMDDSDSMLGMEDACAEAACNFIDSLDEKISLQFASFTYHVKEASQFLPMNDTNREEMKTFIRNKADAVGGTEFNAPLKMALETLKNNQAEGCRSVIILLTDGVASVADSIKAQLNDETNDIFFFTVRLTEDGEGDKSNELVRALTELADQDFAIAPDANGKVDVTEVTSAFRNALTSAAGQVTEEYKKLTIGTDFILEFDSVGSVARNAVKVAVFALYAVLVAMVYYGPQSGKSILLHLVIGLVCGLAYAIEGEIGVFVAWILCMGAYSVYEIGEVQQNV